MRAILPALLLFIGCGLLKAYDFPETEFYDLADPPQGVFTTEWKEIRLGGSMGGQKAGYIHAELSREGDAITSRVKSYMRIGRALDETEMTIEQRTVETLDGKPVSVHNSTLVGHVPIELTGLFEAEHIEVVLKQGEQEYSTFVERPVGTMMNWGMILESDRAGFEEGTEYEVLLYNPEVSPQEVVLVKVSLGAYEKTDYLGERLELQRIEMRMTIGEHDLLQYLWATKDHRVVKTAVDSAGMHIETYLVSEEQALKDFESAEMLVSTMVELNRPLDTKADATVYRLSRSDGERVDLELPQTWYQEVERDEEDLLITVKRTHLGLLGDRITEEGLDAEEDYLGSNLMMDLKDEDLQRLLANALKGVPESPIARARHLRGFVADYIRDTNFSVGFASAGEVARKPEGDCTEHAVLLAALGRLSGIPTRVAAGLAYAPVPAWDGPAEMGYHMWTQFYIDGRWVDLDATLEETSDAPTRIAFMTSALNNSSFTDLCFALLDTIGSIEVSVREIRK